MSKHPIIASRGGMVPTASRRIVPSLAVAFALWGAAAAPLAAQSARVTSQGELVVQNNRTVPVTVYLDTDPIEQKLGTVEALRTASFALPTKALRSDRIKLYLHPKGQLPLQAMGWISGKSDQFALLVPPGQGQELAVPAPVLASGAPNAPTLPTENTTQQNGSEIDG